MNQQIENALGGYEESIATVGGWAMRAQDASVLDKASPDTLLDQIKELRPKVETGKWRFAASLGSDGLPVANAKIMGMATQMADRIIADAERIERLERKFNPDYDCKALLVKEINELRAENERLRDALFDMVWQFSSDGKKLGHSFLSAEEYAFDVLGVENGMSYEVAIQALKESEEL